MTNHECLSEVFRCLWARESGGGANQFHVFPITTQRVYIHDAAVALLVCFPNFGMFRRLTLSSLRCKVRTRNVVLNEKTYASPYYREPTSQFTHSLAGTNIAKTA